MMTVREAAEKWELWVGTRRSAGTLRTYKQLLKPFIEEFGDRPDRQHHRR